MSRYIAFDVETPNHWNNRMSAIGITVVENGSVADAFYSLINPETGFDYFNTRLTGIDEQMVTEAPTFPKLWPTIKPILDSGILVAHNAVFDMGVLAQCLRGYNISWKRNVPYLCTVQMGRRLLPGMSHKLNVLCDYYGIALEHHHAGSDSRGCAELLCRYIKSGAQVDRFLRMYSLH